MTPMPRASKVLVGRRITDLLQVRLDGAQHWDVCEYVREKQADKGSCWFVAEGETSLSDSQIRRYLQRADELIYATGERSRKRLLRRHLAQRRRLYSRAVLSGDLRTALAVLRDEADLLKLYPQSTIEQRLASVEKWLASLSGQAVEATATA
jgi:hypothetical protein